MDMEALNINKPIGKKLDFVELSKKYESMELRDNQEVAVVGYAFIRGRVEQLGLTIVDFEPLKVIDNEDHEEHFEELFSKYRNASAVYSHETNSIGSRHRPELSSMTHEMEHYFTATENMPNSIQKKNRNKSGFNATYVYEKSDSTKIVKDSFRYLNEGITDKLVFDIYKNVSDIEIGEVYEKIFPTKAKKEKEYALEKLRLSIEHVEEKRKQMLLDVKNITDENERLKKEEKINQDIDQFIKRTTSFWENHSNVYISSDYLKHIRGEKYSNYKPFIDMVDKLIEGMATSRMVDSKSESLEVSQKEVWVELQKAYFTGNSLYLRALEKIYGDGFLRKLGTLDDDNGTVVDGHWIEFEDILDIVRKKNEQLRVELENKKIS